MSKSYFMSIVMHVGMLVAALMMAPPLIEKLEDKEIVVEIIEPAPAPQAAHSEVAAAPPVQAAAPEATPVAEEIIAPPAPKVQSKPKPAPVARAKSVSTAKVQVASRATVPETLDDIEASDLDYDSVQIAAAGHLSDGDLDSEFTKVDKKTQADLNNYQAAFDQDLQNTEQETNNELAGLENENKAQSQAMAQALQATRTKNAATLAQLRAGEEAAARRAADIAAANAARAKAAAARAQGNGEGSSGLASGNGKIRSVENLRQRDGNPKPQYAMDERLRREQGTVIFHAFVTSAGGLEQFRLVQSTGYQNLDQKTLAALKKWKFYPGQQGWVEIPQTWNLKGEAEEMPATLRRRISKN